MTELPEPGKDIIGEEEKESLLELIEFGNLYRYGDFCYIYYFS